MDGVGIGSFDSGRAVRASILWYASGVRRFEDLGACCGSRVSVEHCLRICGCCLDFGVGSQLNVLLGFWFKSQVA